MDKNARKNVSGALVLLTLFSIMLVFLPVQRAMAVPLISSISPSSGSVESTITVDGTIDTPNGFFTIRWNQTLNVTTGQAADVNVHASFMVPPTVGAPLGRNVTIELIDDVTGASPRVNFTLFTKFDMSVTVPTAPNQLQEGSTVPIAVNVTGGEENTVYTANITVSNPANQNTSILAPLSNTTTIGYGNVTKIYPTDFAGAHMNYTGTYVVTSNVTNIPQNFTVGLTNKLEYRRNEAVQIQAAGYQPSEPVLVDIKIDEASVAGFPQNVTASSAGVVTSSWKVPLNATRETYTVTVTNATSGGTIKTPSDVQEFEIHGVACTVQTTNRASEPVQNVLVEVQNATTPSILLSQGYTNSTGWITFNLDGGNYTFKAFFKNVEVGGLSDQNLTVDPPPLGIGLDLVNVAASVETWEGEAIPFVDVALKYNFTTRGNQTVSEILSMQTNLTGVAELHNVFTNKTYIVEAKRYDLLFSNTTLTIEPSPTSPWVSLQLNLPTYTFTVHTLDSKNAPASNVQIRVYEWASGTTTPLKSLDTNASGDISLSLPFGKYRLRAYRDSVFLDEATLNLVENQLVFTFSLSTVDIDVTVSVLDYFGQPIANVEVKIERKTNQEFVLIDSKSTGTGGSTLFASILGGDSRISVYVAGKLVAAKTQFLSAGSNHVTFNVGEYVAILGYPIETSVFVLFSFIVVLVVIFVLLNRKRLPHLLRKRPKS